MEVSINKVGSDDTEIVVTYSWNDAEKYSFVGQGMDDEFGRFLVAFFKEGGDPGPFSVDAKFPIGTNDHNSSEHWVIALAIVGTTIAGHDRKLIKDSRVG